MSSQTRGRRLGLLVVGIVVTLAGIPAAVAAQTTGAVSGEVIDGSGAVLPGTTVVATVGEKDVATAVTDDVGRYTFDRLPTGPLTLLFQLDGFDPSRVDLVVQVGNGVAGRRADAAGAGHRERRRLRSGAAAVSAVTPAAAATVIPLPKEDLETVCQPAKPGALPEAMGRLTRIATSTGARCIPRGMS